MKPVDALRYAIDALEERATYLMIEIADTEHGETRAIEKKKLSHLQKVIKNLRDLARIYAR